MSRSASRGRFGPSASPRRRARTTIPDLSVVIPTRDRQDLLGDAVRSVLAQRDVDLEVIVVDDGSVGGCESVVAGFADPRLDLVVHDLSRGVSEARNTGMGRAQGRWIAFLDDDDVWAPDFAAASLTALRATPDRAWSCTGTIHIDATWRVIGSSEPPDPSTLDTDLRRWNVVPTPSCVVVSRTLVEKAGRWDAAFSVAADWDYWMRAAPLSVLATVARPLMAYRYHGSKMSSDASRWRGELDLLHEKHGVVDEPAPGYAASRERAAAWSYLRAGWRRDSVREMGKVARQFRDWRAAACTAAIAVAPRSMARADLVRQRRQVPPAWAREAEGWLAPLRPHE